MDTKPITSERLAASVIAVPPLARNSQWQIDRKENLRLVRFLEQGGINILLYGGNAVLYHVRLTEYAELLRTVADAASDHTLVIPSVGPSFGLMMDQAEVLREFEFPTVMVLPQREICDDHGLAKGIRMFAEKFGKPIVLYLKHDRWLAPDLVGRMHSEGLISWIKYAVVREDPLKDDYLREVLERVPSQIVVSGIGEQPAIDHVNGFGMISFTSGCVCIAPERSTAMLQAIQSGDLQNAEQIRQAFKPLEDLRNGIHPIRVLHRAVELAGIANTGPMLPMLSELTDEEVEQVRQAAQTISAASPSPLESGERESELKG